MYNDDDFRWVGVCVINEIFDGWYAMLFYFRHWDQSNKNRL